MSKKWKTRKRIKPQPWYQEKTLSCPADIVFWWWSAWAWKTFELLLEPMKWFSVPGFSWVIFRRNTPQIKWWGWLWDESVKLYQHIKWSKWIEWSTRWLFKKKKFKRNQKAELKFTHLEYEKDKFSHQGLQYPFIWFDELTHFTKTQFFYLLSRNRSTCWIKPYIRCTCNPDPESWVAEFIERYLDEDWYIRKDRDWVIRYFTIDKDNPVWWNTKQEVIDQCPHIFAPLKEMWEDVSLYVKSFTFIEWDLNENKQLLEKDKTYKANLIAQDEVTKHALLNKCWKALQDDLALVDYNSLNSITSNYLDNKKALKYISIDIAWFWKDLAVLKVWQWFEVLRIEIWKKSAPEDLLEAIERNRKNFKIPKHRVVYDHDWMGWWLAWKNYIAFKWDDPARKYNWVKDNYKNLKTQCYYRIIENVVNEDLMKITETEIYVDWKKTNVIILKKKKEFEVMKLIKDDLKAIKRAKIDMEWKKQINTKAEQKNILWRSPDFWDTIMMRFIFELEKKKPLIIS